MRLLDKDEHRIGPVIMTAVFLGTLAAPAVGQGAVQHNKEAVGFDEVLPDKPEEPDRKAAEPGGAPSEEEKAPVRPPEERPAHRDVWRSRTSYRERPARVQRLPGSARSVSFSVEMGSLLPMKGPATEHGPALSLGARAMKRLGPKMGLALAVDYAEPKSKRGASRFLLADAGIVLSLSGDDISTCPVYAGLAAGLAAESVTDDHVDGFQGNLGPAIRASLGIRLGRRTGVSLGYVAFPGSENSPAVALASLGFSF